MLKHGKTRYAMTYGAMPYDGAPMGFWYYKRYNVPTFRTCAVSGPDNSGIQEHCTIWHNQCQLGNCREPYAK